MTSPRPFDIAEPFSDCLLRDRPRLSRLRRRAQDAPAAEAVRRRDEFDAAVEASRAVVRRRAEARVRLEFPAVLPISAHIDVLARAIERHQVVLVQGATGSGKSTQIGKVCLQLGRGLHGQIGHTQPRRIAARAVADRLARELAASDDPREPAPVGYQVRFEDQSRPEHRIKLMTDGILLQELKRDRLLTHYDTLVVDEIHERSLNIDIILGYLRNLLPRRPELRVILMSATADVERLAAFFDDAATVVVPGQTYPVEVVYQPLDDDDDSDLDVPAGIARAVALLDARDPGDVLCFLPGEREINEAREVLSGLMPDREVLPLYARLPREAQQAVFNPGRRARIILATNVAETSLTVPRVRHVIDSGLARISSYSPRSKLQRLTLMPVSQASADQRRGRCGREFPGICVRLYSEEDFERREAHTPPEIQRTNLAGVALRFIVDALGDLADFPFIDPPPPRLVEDALRLLRELGAIDAEGHATGCGRQMAQFPLDPRLARIVVGAADAGCLREVTIIVSGIAGQDVRLRPPGDEREADAAHASFRHDRSDFMWFVAAWEFLCARMEAESRRVFEQTCRANFLAPRRVREWRDLYDQLAARCAELGFRSNNEVSSYKLIHRTLLLGLADHVGRRLDNPDGDRSKPNRRKRRNERGARFEGARGTRFQLHPGSALVARPPRFVVAAEITETAARYARTVAAVEPEWIERACRHLLNYDDGPPRWDPRAGRMVCLRTERLFGLVLRSGVRIPHARIDAVAARRGFIECALIDGELSATAGFLAYNQAVMARVREREARVRRRDLLLDREALIAVYSDRLPATLESRRQLLAWLEADPTRDAALRFDEAEVMANHAPDVDEYLFPATFELPNARLPLAYRFAPGEDDDGISVTVPLALLETLPPAAFDRLVPGVLAEKVQALMRTLPKQRRRLFAPLAEFAAAATPAIERSAQPLVRALASELRRMSGVAVAETEFDPARLPPYLSMRYVVVGADGAVVASGRRLSELRLRLRDLAPAPAPEDAAAGPVAQSGWPFGPVAEVEVSRQGGLEVDLFPGLQRGPDGVRVVRFASRDEAGRAHREGVRTLVAGSLRGDVRSLRERFEREREALFNAVKLGLGQGLAGDSVAAALNSVLAAQSLPRDEDGFTTVLTAAREALPDLHQAVCTDLAAALAAGVRVQARMAAASGECPAEIVDEVRAQVAALLYTGFAAAVDGETLRLYPRYLEAAAVRLERARFDPNKDLAKAASLRHLVTAFEAGAREGRIERETLVTCDRMLQELRIVVFAPQMRPTQKVSVSKVETAFERCGLL